MDEFESKSKVYIQTDNQGRVTRCEGGYTMSNIDDISEWIFIDEGTGDKYNLCQSHYFEDGIYTEDGISKYVYENDTVRKRTEEEIQEERDSRSDEIIPTEEDDVNALLVEHEYRLTLLELGLTE